MPTNLKLTQANFVRADGYFYHILQTTDTLYKKTDDGTNAFSYPLDTDLANPVVCLQHDGRFFWTLENVTTGNGTLLIKKWQIIDFVLKLQRTYTLTGNSSQKYDCNAFAIEHFHRSFTAAANQGDVNINIDTSRLQAGDILYIGPSTMAGFVGNSESVTINSIVSSGTAQLTTGLQYAYSTGDKIDCSRRCWFFNKFRPNDTDSVNGSGELMSFDINPLSTTVVARKDGNEFRTVLAATFLTDPNYTPTVGGSVTPRDFLVFANQTNLLFIETDESSSSFKSTIQSAAQNNQETNSTVITIFDITHENNTIFRLQNKATYRTGTTLSTEDWGTTQWNYQVAPLSRLPLSISLTANPAIIAADGVTTTPITAIVKDQFDNPVGSKNITFTDDDSTGSPSGAIIYSVGSFATTNSQGIATVSYRAGTVPKTVTITAQT